MEKFEKIQETVAYINRVTDNYHPEIGVILGSGLGTLVDELNIEKTVAYKDIPNFPVSTVAGHKGQLLFARLKNGKRVVAMQGRFHFYEGYPMSEVTFPIFVMKALGVEKLLVSNASGGMNPNYQVGDIVFITQKDYCRLKDTAAFAYFCHLPVAYIPIRTEFLFGQGEEFDRAVRDFVRGGK